MVSEKEKEFAEQKRKAMGQIAKPILLAVITVLVIIITLIRIPCLLMNLIFSYHYWYGSGRI